jgi:hypothetical protein
LALGSSVFQTIKKWPGFVARLKSMALRSEIHFHRYVHFYGSGLTLHRLEAHFHRYDGSWLADAPKLAMEGREPSTALSRAHAHDVCNPFTWQVCYKLTYYQVSP